MARYDNYGQVDDRIVEELDVGFVGFNNRLRPDQLSPGLLTVSDNGRMDINGEWQVRKAMEYVSAPFAAAVLYAHDADTSKVRILDTALPSVDSSSSSVGPGGVLNIVFSSPHGLAESDWDGYVLYLNGWTGDVSIDGNYNIAWVDASTISVTVSGLTSISVYGTVQGPTLDDLATSTIQYAIEYSDPNNDSLSYVLCVGSTGASAVRTSDGSTTEITYPLGETAFNATAIQAFNKVYIFRDGDVAMEWDGDLTGSPAFTLVDSGEYAQPVRLGDGGNNTYISDGVVTVTSTAHGLEVGDLIAVTESSDQIVVGDEYTVASVPNADTFTFFAQYDDQTSHNNHYTKVVTGGIGYSHMPAPPFATYHQRRLVMPYRYDIGGTNASPTITDRAVRDEAIFSQILDGDTYDRIYGQFRFNAGTSDFLVGFHSFSEDKLVVFNRNSIHLVSNSLVLKDSVSTLITNEVGCLARRSIVQVGNNLIFLSDNGIYGVDFQDLYNLRGRDLPLSATIEATIQDINKDYAHKAVGVYFNNRYYLTAPFASSTTNNKIVIYNFVNKNWESVDSVSNPAWEYTHLVVAGDGNDRAVYAVNEQGGVHRLESSLGSNDQYVPAVGQAAVDAPVSGTATTRMYTLSSIDRKKWNNYELHVESSSTQGSNGNVTSITENIDSETDLGTLQTINGGSPLEAAEDYSIRSRLGNRRAYGLQLKLVTTTGRPKLRAVKVAGSTTFRNLEEAQ